MESRYPRLYFVFCALLCLPFVLAAGSEDDVKRFDDLKAKADLGDVASQYAVGSCYTTGKGVLKDQIQAFAYWSLAAMTNDRARRSLATLAAEMSVTSRSYGQQQAKRLQQEIVDNIASSKRKVGVVANPVVPTKNAEPAVKGAPTKTDDTALLGAPHASSASQPSATPASGDTLSEKMGSLFTRKTSDETVAGQTEQQRRYFESMRAAALSGNRSAQCALGMVYRNGSLGVTRDLPNSLTWFQKSADQGDKHGQYWLGRCYFEFSNAERAVAQDPRMAVLWWLKSARQGDAEAQEALGYCYKFGFGVVKDEIEAYAYQVLASPSSRGAMDHRRDFEATLSARSLAAGLERSKELVNPGSTTHGQPSTTGVPTGGQPANLFGAPR